MDYFQLYLRFTLHSIGAYLHFWLFKRNYMSIISFEGKDDYLPISFTIKQKWHSCHVNQNAKVIALQSNHTGWVASSVINLCAIGSILHQVHNQQLHQPIPINVTWHNPSLTYQYLWYLCEVGSLQGSHLAVKIATFLVPKKYCYLWTDSTAHCNVVCTCIRHCHTICLHWDHQSPWWAPQCQRQCRCCRSLMAWRCWTKKAGSLWQWACNTDPQVMRLLSNLKACL